MTKKRGQLNATSKQMKIIVAELKAEIQKIAGLVDVIGCGDGKKRRKNAAQIALLDLFQELPGTPRHSD